MREVSLQKLPAVSSVFGLFALRVSGDYLRPRKIYDLLGLGHSRPFRPLHRLPAASCPPHSASQFSIGAVVDTDAWGIDEDRSTRPRERATSPSPQHTSLAVELTSRTPSAIWLDRRTYRRDRHLGQRHLRQPSAVYPARLVYVSSLQA
ncbi:hypothetical protein C8F01DRAFT_750576 [Mycena amicta]|nr:hypothetical protein C8F01DRAFT_750576 [Mycena amicta]